MDLIVEVAGIAAGCALALGAVGSGARHWALCALVGVVAVPAWLVAALWSGSKSTAAVVLSSVAFAFVLSVVVGGAFRALAGAWSGAQWVAAGGSRRALIAAGVVAIIAARGWLAGLAWRQCTSGAGGSGG